MKFQACKCERVMLLDRRGCIRGFATNLHRGLSVLGLKIDGKAIRFRNPFVSHATFEYCVTTSKNMMFISYVCRAYPV